MKYFQPLYKYRYTLLIILVSIPLIIYAFSLKSLMHGISQQKIHQTLMLQKVSPTTVLSQPVISKSPPDIMLEKIENRQPLSAKDQNTRNKILALFFQNKEAGTLYQNNAIHIDYVKTSDLFQVEIYAKDIDKAKVEANAWFLQQGMSQEGICNYPVQFYLNYNLKQQLPAVQTTNFNPLPPGC